MYYICITYVDKYVFKAQTIEWLSKWLQAEGMAPAGGWFMLADSKLSKSANMVTSLEIEVLSKKL